MVSHNFQYQRVRLHHYDIIIFSKFRCIMYHHMYVLHGHA